MEDAAPGVREQRQVEQVITYGKPYGARRNSDMKKLVTLGLLVATVAFVGTAYGDDGTLQARKLQELFEWSAQAPEATKPAPSYQVYPGYRAPEQAAQSAGAGLQQAKPVPPYQQYPSLHTN